MTKQNLIKEKEQVDEEIKNLNSILSFDTRDSFNRKVRQQNLLIKEREVIALQKGIQALEEQERILINWILGLKSINAKGDRIINLKDYASIKSQINSLVDEGKANPSSESYRINHGEQATQYCNDEESVQANLTKSHCGQTLPDLNTTKASECVGGKVNHIQREKEFINKLIKELRTDLTGCFTSQKQCNEWNKDTKEIISKLSKEYKIGVKE